MTSSLNGMKQSHENEQSTATHSKTKPWINPQNTMLINRSLTQKTGELGYYAIHVKSQTLAKRNCIPSGWIHIW